jgi:hypothetical protein
MLNYQPSSIKYNERVNIRAYRKDGGDYVTTRPLGETIILQTGAMAANTNKEFIFSRYEIPLKINSIYIASNDESKTEIKFTVKIETQTIFDYTLKADEIPLTIPKKTKRLNYRGRKAYNLMKMLRQSDKNQNENQNLRHNPKFLHQI